MTERGPEIDVDKINKPVMKDGIEKGSNIDGTVDTFYYDPNLRPEPVSGDALKTMTEEQQQEYQKILDKLKGACGLRDEKQQSSFSDGQKAGAWASLVTFLATGTGVAAAETVSPSDTKAKSGTEIASRIEGEIPSKTALDKMMAKASAGISDVTPAAQPTPLGPEATPTPSVLDLVAMNDEVFKKYAKETGEMAMDLNTPLSEATIERAKNCLEAWRIRTFGPYEEELKGLGAKDGQWIKRGAQWLYAYDNSTWLNPENPGEKFQNYISREEIIKYVVEGKGKNVFCDPDGRPLFLIVNMTDKMKKGIEAGLKLLVNKGVDGVYDYFYESGSCVLFAALLEPEESAGRALLNEYGVTGFNFTEDNSKKYKAIDMTHVFARKVPEEAFGIDFCQSNVAAFGIYNTSVDRETINDGEVFKKNNAGEILLSIDDDYMNKSGTGLINSAKQDYYNSAKSDLYNRQTEMMIEMYNLAGENFLVTTEK